MRKYGTGGGYSAYEDVRAGDEQESVSRASTGRKTGDLGRRPNRRETYYKTYDQV